MNEGQVPVIRLSMTRTIGESSQIICETYTASDAPRETLDAMMDKLGEAMDRQAAKAELPALEKRYHDFERAYLRGEEDMARIDREHADRAEKSMSTGRRQPIPLTNAQKVDLEKAQASIARWKQDALDLRKMIDEHKARIGG